MHLMVFLNLCLVLRGCEDFQQLRFSGITPLECIVRFLIRSLFNKLAVKGTVHPKMKIHYHVVPNLYELIVMFYPNIF